MSDFDRAMRHACAEMAAQDLEAVEGDVGIEVTPLLAGIVTPKGTFAQGCSVTSSPKHSSASAENIKTVNAGKPEPTRPPDSASNATQQDAAIVAAMAEQALEDADCITEMLDAGCSMDECRAAFSDGRIIN